MHAHTIQKVNVNTEVDEDWQKFVVKQSEQKLIWFYQQYHVLVVVVGIEYKKRKLWLTNYWHILRNIENWFIKVRIRLLKNATRDRACTFYFLYYGKSVYFTISRVILIIERDKGLSFNRNIQDIISAKIISWIDFLKWYLFLVFSRKNAFYSCFFKSRSSAPPAITAWLIKIPQRYPLIPAIGIINNTNPIRMPRPITFKKKVEVVLPRPFKILCSVVERYKNGHIHPNVTIKVPARLLANKKSPIHLPKSKNNKVQRNPRRRL